MTTNRRKAYTVDEKRNIIRRYANYLRRLKLKHNYTAERIVNFDECPVWFDMPAAKSLNRKGKKENPINGCNYLLSKIIIIWLTFQRAPLEISSFVFEIF